MTDAGLSGFTEDTARIRDAVIGLSSWPWPGDPLAEAFDLGPCEVTVNDTRYVREETLFAAMRELDKARDDLATAERERDEAREMFAAMKSRVEAASSAPAYRRHHETWQEAADRLMRERDGETRRATQALADLAAAREALREIAERCESEMFASEEQAEFASQRARAALAGVGETPPHEQEQEQEQGQGLGDDRSAVAVAEPGQPSGTQTTTEEDQA